jgi:4-hydroxy-tetrahydrodipicolinate reductase
MIKVIVNGAKGKMGAMTVDTVKAAEGLALVGALDINDDLKKSIEDNKPDVVIDFTHPSCVKENTLTVLNCNCRPIIGTTGLSENDLDEIAALSKEKGLGTLVIPNFAIGAVLMMKFAKEAAKHMPRVEIIEWHHDKKADSPSGTAIKTAEVIYESNNDVNKEELVEKEIIVGTRGGEKNNIPIHAVRLPGYVASQEVIFGGLAQTLKIRHDTISRESFMPGVVLCAKKIQDITGLVYGMENII